MYCVFDTETVGKTQKLVYDFGMAIADKTGEIYFSKRWLIKEVVDIPLFFELPFYNKRSREFTENVIPTPLAEVKAEVAEIFSQFKVNVITAYNLSFDFGALSDTMKLASIKGKFFEDTEYFDLWNASCNSFLNQKNYKKVARENGWVSEVGNISTTAENAYRYIVNNPQFVETHTALEDVVIEVRILQEICRQKKAKQKNTIVRNPWKKIQERSA